MNPFVKGALIATAAAGLMFTVGCGTDTGSKTQEVKCIGSNACKGQSACQGKDKDGTEHDCAGKNACKGQGWTKEKSEADCTAKGGTVSKS